MKITIAIMFWAFIIIAEATVFNTSMLENKLQNENNLEREPITYLVSVKETYVPFCSGCMISSSFILTSAECVVKIMRKKKPDFSTFRAVVDRTEYMIKRVNYHQYYDFKRPRATKHNDVGLILIKGSIDSNEEGWIHYATRKVLISIQATVFGWLSQRQNVTSINVNIIHPDECKTQLNYMYMQPKKQMCGELQATNAKFVQIESGSPLIFEGEIIGIATFQRKRIKNPVVFIRTDVIDDYIRTTQVLMQEDNYTINTFTLRKSP